MASMRFFQQLVILLFFSASNADFVFSNPPNTEPGTQHFLAGWAIDNPIYQIGSEFNVTWATDWTGYTLYLSQLQVEGFSGYQGSFNNIVLLTKNSSDAETGGLEWSVEIGTFSIATSPIFFFTAINSASTNVVTYGIFNVTENTVISSTSTAGATSTSSITSSGTPATTAGSTATASSTTTAAATSAVTDISATSDNSTTQSSSSSNKSSELGLGIGLGGGLIFVAFIATALLYKVLSDKKKNKSSSFPKPLYNRELPASPVSIQRINPHDYELQG